MIQYKTKEEVAIIKESADILGKAHAEVAKLIKPGIKTIQLDKIAEEYIKDNGGIPSFKNFNGFPSSLCISVNEAVVHGFPGEYELKEGDIISVDCGVFYKGFHSDSAYTYPIGNVSEDTLQLLRVTKESLNKGIEAAKFGARIGDIGFEVQSYVEKLGFSVVRELVGHGVGRKLHERPEVPNFGKRGQGIKLQEGLVIAIEPMINLGKKAVVQERDGWTIRTADRKPSAHFEHTVAVFKDKTEVLTTFKYIEEVFKF
ncbi:MAG TPA: type I methionyl aminopeptidase [Cytophagales bacterium]|nr:type I methionyl aminopeptidase [Cytophagales bacterium]